MTRLLHIIFWLRMNLWFKPHRKFELWLNIKTDFSKLIERMKKCKEWNVSPIKNWKNLMREFPKMQWKQDGLWKWFDTISDYRVVLKNSGDCDDFISVALEYFGDKIYYNDTIYVNNGYSTILYKELFNGHVIGIWESLRDDSVFVVSNRNAYMFDSKYDMLEWFKYAFDVPAYMIKQTKNLDVVGVMKIC